MQAAFPPVEAPAKRPTASAINPGGPVDIGVLRAALDHLRDTPHPDHKGSRSYADHYEAWVLFGLAIYRALGEEGFELWDEWSSSAERYPGTEVCRKKWSTFAASVVSSNPVTVGTIFHTARRHGFSLLQAQTRSALQSALAKYNKQAIADHEQA